MVELQPADEERIRRIIEAYDRRKGILHSSEACVLLAIVRRMLEGQQQLRLRI